MKLRIARVAAAFLPLVLSLTPFTRAQTTTQTTSALPRLVRFGGTVKDLNGSPLTGVVGITFAFYSEKTGGAPLWLETQNATADANGHYAVLLGSTKSDGVPAELFTSEQARWVGVQVSGQAEQPRALLVSAPYALKAGDAETIGGLPPSAFVLAAPLTIGSGTSSSTAATVPPPAATDVTTTGGTANYLPIFSGADTIIDSAVFQTGSGTTAKVGIDTTTPVTQLDVNGAGTMRGTLSLPATGLATAAGGKNSQGLNIVASSFDSTSSTALNQVFRWQAEPAANDTISPTGTLNLQYGLGTATPTETGLKVSSKGVLTFATGQTFPGTGDGSVTSIATGLGLTGGTITKTGTLTIDTTVVPQLAAANTFTANQTIDGNLSATGTVRAGILRVADITASDLNAADVSLTGFFSISSSSANPVVASSSAASATTIEGVASAATGEGWGVQGITDSSAGDAYGVYGAADASSGSAVGVYGDASSTTAIGVFGQNGAQSSLEEEGFVSGAGVWGDGGSAGSSGPDVNIPGVVGTSTGSSAGWFENNSSGFYTAIFIADNSTGSPFYATNFATDKGCTINYNGDLSCDGTKNAVVPIDGGKRKVALSAIESPKNWFEDAGAAELVNGMTVVTLDPDFIQTVNTELEYMVFPVPNGDCKGLYVSRQTPTSFEVHELGGGTSNVHFYYRIMALRKKYENVRFADHTNDPDPRKMLRRSQAAGATNRQSHMPTKQLSAPRPSIQTTAVR
jgi:hypothetical protein